MPNNTDDKFNDFENVLGEIETLLRERINYGPGQSFSVIIVGFPDSDQAAFGSRGVERSHLIPIKQTAIELLVQLDRTLAR